MVQITHSERRGVQIDYGESEAPIAARERVVDFFDDGDTRTRFVDVPLSDLTALFDASLAAQRDAVAATSGERAVRIQELEALAESQAEQIAALTEERDQARAQYEQLLSEVEPA